MENYQDNGLGVPGAEPPVGLSAVSLPPVGDAAAIPNAQKLSWNHNVLVYPNDKGWAELKRLRALYHRISQHEADDWIERGRTADGAFKEQLWQIAAEFHSMFYNGSTFWRNTYLDFMP